MTRDEIAKRIEIAFPGWQGEILMLALERAGLCIIPKEPDDAEIERVAPAIARQLLLYAQMAKMAFRANDLEMAARAAAAAAVRMTA